MSPKRVGQYELNKTLGEGTFGKVKQAENVETHEQFAIKIIDKDKIMRHNMGTQIKREISTMKVFSHPNIVQLKEVLASKKKIYLVLELVTGGELFDEIVRQVRFTEEKARFYFQQLVSAVETMHGKGVCHRDLKPENLLLDQCGNLKISDFGLSALYNESSSSDETMSSRKALLHTTCGTPSYVAPEVLEDNGYDGRLADIWSIGVILYVLVAGHLPFDEKTLPALFEKIQLAQYKFPSRFSPGLKDLISKILVANPKERISLCEIAEHRWYRQNDDSATEIPLASNNLGLEPNSEGNSLNDQTTTNAKYTSSRNVMISTDLSSVKGTDLIDAIENFLKNSIKCKTSRKRLLPDATNINNSKTKNRKQYRQHKIKAEYTTSKGLITMNIVFDLNKSAFNITRVKGDILEYQKLFLRVKDKIELLQKGGEHKR